MTTAELKALIAAKLDGDEDLALLLAQKIQAAQDAADAAQATADAIVSGFTPDPDIADLGATSNLPAAALSTSDTYTDAAVNTAINDLKSAAETRLDNAEAKIDAILAALRSVGIIA